MRDSRSVATGWSRSTARPAGKLPRCAASIWRSRPARQSRCSSLGRGQVDAAVAVRGILAPHRGDRRGVRAAPHRPGTEAGGQHAAARNGRGHAESGANLLPYETAAGNVQFAQGPTRRTHSAKRRRTAALLEAVGLAGVAHRPAGRLSGGEQQRLAIAVALANGPALLLADEPTSQLDHRSAATVIDLIRAANQDVGTTVVVVTHDPAVGKAMGRTVTIRDGRVGAEGHAGEDYLLVARDGSIQLPMDLLDVLPPGSLASAVKTADGVILRRADIERG